MNEELTNEALEAMTKCKLDCATCCANAVCRKYDWPDALQAFATALLEERAKPKVWDGAPEWAERADVSYKGNVNGKINISIYTRELPKTRIDEIADEVWHEINKGVTGLPIDIIKRGLKKYAEELEGKE